MVDLNLHFVFSKEVFQVVNNLNMSMKNYRLEQRLVDIKLQYAVFLNQLKQYEGSSKVVNQTLGEIVSAYQKRFPHNRNPETRRLKYQQQRFWKKLIIGLLLQLDNVKQLQNYPRVYQISHLIKWMNGSIYIQSFPFKKCVQNEFDGCYKLINGYVESHQQFKVLINLFFGQQIRNSSMFQPKNDSNISEGVYDFYNNQMYNIYENKKLNNQFIKVLVNDQNKIKINNQNSKISSKKSSRRAYHNSFLEKDSVKQQPIEKSFFDDQLFYNHKQKSVFNDIYDSQQKKNTSKLKNSTSHKIIRNIIQNQDQEIMRQPTAPTHTPKQPDQNIIRADQFFFQNFIKQKCNLQCYTTGTKTPANNFLEKHLINLSNDQTLKKQSAFQKKILKMKHQQQLPLSNLNSFVNVIAQKRKIKRQEEFIYAIVQKEKPKKVDVYVNKDQHGISIPLKGIDMFVQIILQNRGVLAITKLAQKHDIVRKKRQMQNKSKKRNEQKQKLRILYKIQEGKRSYLLQQSTLAKLSGINSKRKNNFNKNKINKQFFQSSLMGTQHYHKMDEKFKKQIQLNNAKSQETIKQVSQKIETNLRQEGALMSNKNRKLRKVNMLDERFNSLRESINTTKGSEELFWVK